MHSHGGLRKRIELQQRMVRQFVAEAARFVRVGPLERNNAIAGYTARSRLSG
jgi:hypothetical protein